MENMIWIIGMVLLYPIVILLLACVLPKSAFEISGDFLEKTRDVTGLVKLKRVSKDLLAKNKDPSSN